MEATRVSGFAAAQQHIGVQQRRRFLLRQRIDLAFGDEQELQACVVAAEQGMFVEELQLTRSMLADLLESSKQMSAEKHLSADMCAAEESVTCAFNRVQVPEVSVSKEEMQQMMDSRSKRKKSAQAKAASLQVGDQVLIRDVRTHQELNGLRGVLLAFEESWRWRVRLEGILVDKLLLEKNMMLVSQSADMQEGLDELLLARRFEVEVEHASVHEVPSNASPTRGHVAQGQIIHATEQTFDGWVRVRYEARDGWMKRRSTKGLLLALLGEEPHLPTLGICDEPGLQPFEVLETCVVRSLPSTLASAVGSWSAGEEVYAESQTFNGWLKLGDGGWVLARDRTGRKALHSSTLDNLAERYAQLFDMHAPDRNFLRVFCSL
uniref:SH3 domain-containing protein n=1 Tax=Noctiluca scintillans TaxID=2966 RepID=A0A7S1FCV9_NOCSC|mmetsp:Transcript_50841/g.135721  ORF Transcript_50841/g.135721 Transcript_50841/m.135721 type:complete len:378 (+) Transcript_50841:65-1198(+)